MYDPADTDRVLSEVREHRAWQAERYFALNQTMPDGTGPDTPWLPGLPHSARTIEMIIRADWNYDTDPDPALMSWMRLLREEVAEAFACADATCLRTELVQVAAVAVSWIETLDARAKDTQLVLFP
jgi:hypothetical protein